MQLNNTALDETLQEIKDLEAEIKSQENKYNSLVNADKSSEISREIQIKIRHLKLNWKLSRSRYGFIRLDRLTSVLFSLIIIRILQPFIQVHKWVSLFTGVYGTWSVFIAQVGQLANLLVRNGLKMALNAYSFGTSNGTWKHIPKCMLRLIPSITAASN